jgi:hypothetical protein
MDMDLATMKTAYQQADAATMLKVVEHESPSVEELTVREHRE